MTQPAKRLLPATDGALRKLLGPFPLVKATTYGELESFYSVAGWTKEILGESSEAGVYVHGFQLGDGTKPVIMYQAGIHGMHEWRSVHHAVRVMSLLASPGWKHGDLVKRIRQKFDFYFIPCLNPYGYIANVYCNKNNINLNRNYSTLWDSGLATPSPAETCETTNYGPFPFSEPEIEISATVMSDKLPVLFLDGHSKWSEPAMTIGAGTVLAPQYKNPIESYILAKSLFADGELALWALIGGPISVNHASSQKSSIGTDPACIILEPQASSSGQDPYNLAKAVSVVFLAFSWAMQLLN